MTDGDRPSPPRRRLALVAHRGDREDLGYSADEDVADVDWDRLTAGKLSTTEVATVHIARGCAIVKGHGGGRPPSVHAAVRAAIEDLTH